MKIPMTIGCLWLVLFVNAGYADTHVSGNVSGEWDEDGSPYIVDDDLTVSRNEALSINAGTEIRFEPGNELRVFGTLTAVGAEDDMITFTTNENDETWRGIRLIETADESEISFCIIEHSERPGRFNDIEARGGAIYGQNCEDLIISNNIFRSNSADGQGIAVNFNHCTGEFTSNLLTDHNSFTIMAVFDGSDMPITNNIIENNTAEHGCCIFVRNASPPVTNNIVRGNNSTTMSWGCAYYFERNCQSRFYNNIAYENQGGAVYVGSGVELEDFDHNILVANPGRCSIIFVGGRAEISNSVIWDENDPIWISSGSCSAEYSLIEDFEDEGINVGEGMLDEDPGFTDIDAGDFHLTDDSPCIDAGDPDSPEDPDGSRADIGHVFEGAPFHFLIEPDSVEMGFVGLNDTCRSSFNIIYNQAGDDPIDLQLDFEISVDDEWLYLEIPDDEISYEDTLQIGIVIDAPDTLQPGEYDAIISFSAVDWERYIFQLPVEVNFVEGFGNLLGIITDASNDQPVQDAEIVLVEADTSCLTDENGRYCFEELPAGFYQIILELDDYLPYSAEIEIEPDGERTHNIGCLHATCDVTPEELVIDVKPDSSVVTYFTIENGGNGMLEYELSIDFPDQGEYEAWEVLRRYDIELQCRDEFLQGVEFDGTNFYVSGANNHDGQGMIHVFGSGGNYIESFDQFRESRWGMRDLAWDGEALWGGDGADIFRFSPEGELIDEIQGPLNRHRALTWDSDNGLLWVCDIETEIIGIDAEGDVVENYQRDPQHRIFGLATSPEDPDSCTIYAFCLEGEFDTQINKMNPETGEWQYVVDLDTGEEYMAGGAVITHQWDPMSYVFAGILRGRDDASDMCNIWHVADRTDWISVDSSAGSVNGEDEIRIPIRIDASDFVHETELTSEIIVHHNGRGNRIRIPIEVLVTLEVEPELGDQALPDDFKLFEPFPNPFNSSVSISYFVRYSENIQLELININGKLIRTLSSGLVHAGHHSVNLNSQGLTSGIYLIRLKSSGKSAICKLTLVK